MARAIFVFNVWVIYSLIWWYREIFGYITLQILRSRDEMKHQITWPLKYTNLPAICRNQSAIHHYFLRDHVVIIPTPSNHDVQDRSTITILSIYNHRVPKLKSRLLRNRSTRHWKRASWKASWHTQIMRLYSLSCPWRHNLKLHSMIIIQQTISTTIA